MILIDPSELSTNSLLPPLENSKAQPGLEELTGCDFVIARLPLPIQDNTLEAHIKSGALFVQRKSGYDFIGDFEQAHREIARVQACGIPMQQVFLLAIGQYYPKDGLLRITGKQPLENGRSITYDTFLALEAEYRFSGVQVVRLNDESEIQPWIDAQVRELETIQKRNNRKELYPNTKIKIVEPSPDVFQEVVEVPPDDIRYFLACGLKGFGQKTADSLVEYAETQVAKVNRWGVYALKLLTDENAKGKPIYDIPGWGDKSRQRFRDILGLPRGYNLSVQEIEFDADRSFKRGWRMALEVFRDLLDNGQPPRQAFEATYNFTFEFYDEIKK